MTQVYIPIFLGSVNVFTLYLSKVAPCNGDSVGGCRKMKPGGDVYRATRTTRLHTWFVGRIITLVKKDEEVTVRKLAKVQKENKTKLCLKYK